MRIVINPILGVVTRAYNCTSRKKKIVEKKVTIEIKVKVQSIYDQRCNLNLPFPRDVEENEKVRQLTCV